jgi:hypothetical protein
MTRLTITDEATRTVVITALWRMVLQSENLGDEDMTGRFWSLWDVLSKPDDRVADEQELDLLLERVTFLREQVSQVQAVPLGEEVDAPWVSTIAEHAEGICVAIQESAELWLDRPDADEILHVRSAAKRLLAEQLQAGAVA